jgi:pimeloyl-ACP methyl ester carboxylesterase
VSAVDRLSEYSRDGLTFDVLDEGPLDGDPVVLLHGFPERATCWRHVAPILHEHGLRTYAPDQRGYSPRARPSHRWSYRVQDLVADVVALIDEIGRPVHLVGHDWGAAVGWTVAGRHPDKVRTWTAVSVPHPAAFGRAVLTSRQARKSWYMVAFQVPWLPELQADTFADALGKGGMTPEEVERFKAEILDYGAFSSALMWYRGIPFSDPRVTGGRVRVPTAFVWSDRDVAVGPQGGRLNPRFVDAPYQYVELTGVSHWIPTQAPQQLAQAILARIDEPTADDRR